MCICVCIRTHVVDLMSMQVHALRDAMAIARVLNRTLIIPHFDCLCDRSEYPDVMPSCVYYGAPPRLKIPFRCSTHFVTDTHKLQVIASSDLELHSDSL